MANFNQVTLMGNVTREPTLKVLPNQQQVVEFGLASNRRYRTAAGEDKEEVCFVDCAAFGRQAEVLHQYAHKGRPLFVQGRLRYESWEDKQGNKRSRLSVVVEQFQLLGSRPEGSHPGSDAEGGKAAPERNPAVENANRRAAEQIDIPF